MFWLINVLFIFKYVVFTSDIIINHSAFIPAYRLRQIPLTWENSCQMW